MSRVQAPAGLEIGAVSPEEIAVSILAEMVRVARSSPRPAVAPRQDAEAESRDPVCGMTVDVGRAKYKSDYRGGTVHFCCGGCKQAFDKSPEKYLAVVEN